MSAGTIQRRDRRDIRLGRRLEIGQVWRNRWDGRCWRIEQVHRADCHVELELLGCGWKSGFDPHTDRGSSVTASRKFSDLRTDFDQLIPADKEVA